jgi:D-serine deaminase-like pyridoxal phosphate-dependent protein
MVPVNFPLASLETPVPVVDLDRLARNLDRTARYAKDHGLALRPHIKTHKSSFIAAEQMQLGAVGLTCATPYEAEMMSDVTDDLLVAYPPIGEARLRRVLAVPDRVHLTLALDSEFAIRSLAEAARTARRDVGVYIELDMGMRRVGVADIDEAIALARVVRASAPLEFAGIAFYPGHVREPVGEQDRKLAEISAALRDAIDRFSAAGVEPRVVSGGSTPTLFRSHEIDGVTEIRPGTYVFNDRTTAAIGACAWEDCALTVVSTVVSTAVPGQAVIDAGTKALGREPMRGSADEGYGVLLEHPDVVVKQMSEEHGILDLSRTTWQPSVGERVRVIPNHVCIVVQLNDEVFGIRGDMVESSWPVLARGRGYDLVAANLTSAGS